MYTYIYIREETAYLWYNHRYRSNNQYSSTNGRGGGGESGVRVFRVLQYTSLLVFFPDDVLSFCRCFFFFFFRPFYSRRGETRARIRRRWQKKRLRRTRWPGTSAILDIGRLTRGKTTNEMVIRSRRSRESVSPFVYIKITCIHCLLYKKPRV